MLKDIIAKNNYLLFILVGLLVFASYQLAIKRTIAAWQTNKEMKRQSNSLFNLSYQPDYEKRKGDNIDKILDLYNADTSDFRNKSINTIASAAEKHNVKLIEIPSQLPEDSDSSSRVERLAFEGDYDSLLTTLYVIESTSHIRGV